MGAINCMYLEKYTQIKKQLVETSVFLYRRTNKDHFHLVAVLNYLYKIIWSI